MNPNTKVMGGKPPSVTMSTSNTSILLEKFNGRRSTPDSEVLASSDDEVDRQEPSQSAAQPQKPTTRRASWLNDTIPTSTQARKGSFASSSKSPTTSHPSTPSAETGTWAQHSQAGNGIGARGHAGSTTFPWGSGIWNADARKEPPSRLTEVLPSPKSMTSPSSAGNGYFGDLSSSRDQTPNPTIPFTIPLHPTPKTYRSQSYSVGQLDPDAPASVSTHAAGPIFTGRNRPLQHSGLQHRPSRPSMLSEMSNEGGGLGKLKEVDDDDNESPNSSHHGLTLQAMETRTIEMLAREHAKLRQTQYSNARVRSRSSASNAFSYGLHETLPEESDSAIDELDEMNESCAPENVSKGKFARRLSEYGATGPNRISYAPIENRKLENIKKAYWQSSLGFGGLVDIPQSRRHSFAEIPTRHGSVGSAIGDPLSSHESAFQDALSKDYQSRYQEPAGYSVNEHAASYFGTNTSSLPRNMETYGGTAYQQSNYPFTASTPYVSTRAASPQRSMYAAPQPRHNQLLYMVLFKCSRSDVFYVQEGTGLSVKPGDLVIVEADRGTDLGTVARANVDWATAKELKAYYSEEHYKWLMMYSQGASGNQDGTGAGLMAASSTLQASAVGGMGPPSQHGIQEPNPSEMKPKIIKRLAQQHEIQGLREKEGNEAKAKRVCMQKVKEHGLHMEILDAEFQMDWKKLTFYYFADAYINFNSLVTDLFKVYKTRIWMSAVNPASFASPSLGLQAPSGIGPGAVGGSRTTQPTERRQPQPAESSLYTQPQAGRSYANSFGTTAPYLSTPYYGFSPFSSGTPRNTAVSPAGFVPLDPYGGYPASSDYQGLPTRFPSPHVANSTHERSDFRRSSISAPNDGWIGTFQGLSMNSR